jgi:hypothetical protein
MARYFFSFQLDGDLLPDDEGVEPETVDLVRVEAMRVLQGIAKDVLPTNGDHQTFRVIVTNSIGTPVFSASLTYAGLWLS